MKLTKDETILQLLLHLEQTFGKGSFQVEDYWEADFCAIGLADIKGSYLLYVNTFGKLNNTYYAEFEEKKEQGSFGKQKAVFEHLTTEGLDELFSQYFLNEVR